jgi:hypothetical protein
MEGTMTEDVNINDYVDLELGHLPDNTGANETFKNYASTFLGPFVRGEYV